MSKLNISINLLGLQGASLITSKAGTECAVLIDLNKARAKKHPNGKVYLNLDAVENKEGRNQYGKTHFIVEPLTREERQAGSKAIAIGNGEEVDFKKRQDAPKRQETAKNEPEIYTDANGDEIPF